MAYEDFKLNPQEFEKMAKEFGQMQSANICENDDLDGEVELSQKQASLLDILLGLKILERLFLGCRDKCKNQNVVRFVNENLIEVEDIERNISKMSENLSSTEIDFEFPDTEGGAIKMIETILASLLQNLSEALELIEEEGSKKFILKAISKLAEWVKDIINLIE